MPSYSVNVNVGFNSKADYQSFLGFCDNCKLSFRGTLHKLIYDKLEAVRSGKALSDLNKTIPMPKHETINLRSDHKNDSALESVEE